MSQWPQLCTQQRYNWLQAVHKKKNQDGQNHLSLLSKYTKHEFLLNHLLISPTRLVLGSITPETMKLSISVCWVGSWILQEQKNTWMWKNSFRNKFVALNINQGKINAGPMIEFTLPTADINKKKIGNKSDTTSLTDNVVSHFRDTLPKVVWSPIPELKILVDTNQSSTRNHISNLDTFDVWTSTYTVIR